MIDTREYYGGLMPELDEYEDMESLEERLEYERERDEFYADLYHEEMMLASLENEDEE